MNPRTKKLVKIIKEERDICGRNKSQIFTQSMTRGESFVENAKCTPGYRSAMSVSARCDFNGNCTVLKLHDKCRKPECNCQDQITFTPKQYMLEGNGFKNTMKKIFKG